MKKVIPHLLTLGNLVCGVLAIRAVSLGQVESALIFVAVAAFLDFFDGMVARLLGVSGELGKQLDSLADNVTFGVVPGFMFLSMAGFLTELPSSPMGWFTLAACLLVPAMATLRLAKFNIDENQTQGFIGVPTPANTIFVGSLFYMFNASSDGIFITLLQNPLGFFAVALVAAIWQVLPIPLIALKFKSWGFKENLWRYLFIIVALLLVVFLQIEGIPLAILCYFLFSILARKMQRKT